MRNFKFLIIAFIAVFSFSFASAQTDYVKPKLRDNWSITVKGGVDNYMTDMFHPALGTFGLEFEKELTPITGIGVEGEWFVNNDKNQYDPNGVNRQYVGAFMTTNWMGFNYNGQRKLFEVETVLGCGWGHFYNHSISGDKDAGMNYLLNTFVTKAGVNINFNLGKEKAWTIALKPAVLYDMHTHKGIRYDKRYGHFELQGGVTYHFKNHDSRHTFSYSDKVVTQKEIDAMNETINQMRRDGMTMQEEYQNQLQEKDKQIGDLYDELEKCRNEQVITPKFECSYPIQFKKESAELTETSYAGLKQLADEMNAVNANYKIIGYASVDGPEDYNKELSEKRAKSVFDKLVSLGVPTEKMEVFGNGETEEFSKTELELNRIVIVME